MQENQGYYHRKVSFLWVGLVAWGAILLLAIAFHQARAADSPSIHDAVWGIGEGVGEGERFLSDQNADIDTDGDGITDAEEGSEALPGTYGGNALNDFTLCTLNTIGGRVSMKIDKGRFENVHAVGDDEIRTDPNHQPPDKSITDPAFPYGFISFNITGLDEDGDDEVNLKIFFPVKVNSHALLCHYYYKQWLARIGYDIGDGDFWKYDTENLPKQYHQQSITVTLRDNNYAHDSDIQDKTGRAGIILDPWGLGIPKSSSGKGRCFIQALSGHEQHGN